MIRALTSLLTFDSFLRKGPLSFNIDSLSPSKYLDRDSTERTESLPAKKLKKKQKTINLHFRSKLLFLFHNVPALKQQT